MHTAGAEERVPGVEPRADLREPHWPRAAGRLRRFLRGTELIALTTLRKASREKIFYIIPLVTIVVLAMIQNLKFFEVGIRVKVLKDLGLTTLSLFGFFLALAVAFDLVSYELETKTIHFLFSKPVSRAQFLAGKFLGISVLLAVNLLIVGGELLVLVLIYDGSFDANLAKGFYVTFLKLSVFTSMVLMLSTMLSPILTFFTSLLLYVVGHAVGFVEDSLVAGTPVWFQTAVHSVLYFSPDFSHFDTSYVVVHSYAIPSWYIGLLTGYAAAYCALFLLIGCVVLEATDVP